VDDVVSLIKKAEEIFESTEFRKIKKEKIEFIDIAKLILYDKDFTMDLLNDPVDTLKSMEIAFNKINKSDVLTKLYIKNLPKNFEVDIGDISSSKFNKFVQVSAEITDKSKIFHRILCRKFECPTCGNIIKVFMSSSNKTKPTKCGCGNKGNFNSISQEVDDFINISLRQIDDDGNLNEIKCIVDYGILNKLGVEKFKVGSKVKVLGLIKPIFKNNSADVDKELMAHYIEFLQSNEEIKFVDVENLLNTINDIEFEQLVAKIWEKKGYGVEITKRSGDFGIDIIAEKDHEKLVIQCKHNKSGALVDNSVIQKALGSAHSPYNVKKVAVVTSSSFSPAAEKVAEKSTIPVELIDRNKLIVDVMKFYYDVKDISTLNGGLTITDKEDSKLQENIVTLRSVIKTINRNLGKGKLSFDLILKNLEYGPLSVKSFEEYKELFEEVCKIENINLDIDWEKHRDKLNNLISSQFEDTGEIDIDRITTGISNAGRGSIFVLKEIISDLENEYGRNIPIDAIIEKAGNKDITEEKVQEVIEKLKRVGEICEFKRGFLGKI